MNAIKLNKIDVSGVLSIVSIRRDSWEVGEIAKFKARAVQAETIEPCDSGRTVVRLFTGYALELKYPGDVAIGATVVALRGDIITVLPDTEGQRSDYGDYRMLASDVLMINSKQAALQPVIKDEELIRRYCIPTDITLVISYSGVDIRSRSGAGSNWVMTTDERLMSFKWDSA